MAALIADRTQQDPVQEQGIRNHIVRCAQAIGGVNMRTLPIRNKEL